MAQRALPPGAIRRRTAFGLLDVDGWTWAGLKATFWFVVIVFLLGYVPNQAYFFTVSNTVEVGYNFASIVNWCPSENENLPCPTPAGAVLPWQTSPAELALPEARAGSSVFQTGTTVALIGGTVGNDSATDEVLLTEISLEGNFSPWAAGPSLPAARTDAALGVYLGIPYVIGGLDADHNAVDTVFKGIVEGGELIGWEVANGEDGTDPLTLKQPLSSAGVIVGTSGFVLLGGRNADGEPIADIDVAWVDDVSSGTRLLGWQPFDAQMPAPRADAVVDSVGNFVYVVGGLGPAGVTDTVYRVEFDDREFAHDENGETIGWVDMTESSALPERRAAAIGFAANGSVYVIGGFDSGTETTDSMYWAVSDQISGDFVDGWQRLEQTDLPVPVADAPLAGVGATAFIFGGQDADGLRDGSLRAGLSPRPPFFQLGIAGATLPALAIEGEVGQQLGYINAATVGGINFVLLILIGIAYAHQSATRRIISRLSGGRLAVDPEDEYGA